MITSYLNLWREKNGLDYDGWLRFIVKRKLRRLKLGFIVPFDMSMDWRNSSSVELSIWEWGTYRSEKYKFYIDRPLASDFSYKLRNEGIISSKTKYKVIKAIGYTHP